MTNTRKIVFAALFAAVGVVLPQAFHMIPNAGSIFLPMHIPVLFCGLLCGPFYGAACGAIACLLSHLIFSMPPAAVFPGMLIELIVYGCIAGVMAIIFKNKNIGYIYLELIIAMLCGRIVAGVLNALIFRAGAYSLQVWMTSSFVTALPGIIIQLVLIPILVERFKKYF